MSHFRFIDHKIKSHIYSSTNISNLKKNSLTNNAILDPAFNLSVFSRYTPIIPYRSIANNQKTAGGETWDTQSTVISMRALICTRDSPQLPVTSRLFREARARHNSSVCTWRLLPSWVLGRRARDRLGMTTIMMGNPVPLLGTENKSHLRKCSNRGANWSTVASVNIETRDE